MKQKSAEKNLPVITVCCGILALILRFLVYRTAVDARNLLITYHPLRIAMTVLTLGVLARILLVTWKRKNESCYEAQASDNLSGAIGYLASGAGILVTVLTVTPDIVGHIYSIWKVLGMAAPVCLLINGAARMLGKRPFFLFQVVTCLFFMAHIVTFYQLWSAHPQMQDYIFALLGAMALMFFGFYTAAMEADCGNLPVMMGMGEAAIYLCLAELARSSCPGLYLGGAIWVLTNLCSMRKTIQE